MGAVKMEVLRLTEGQDKRKQGKKSSHRVSLL